MNAHELNCFIAVAEELNFRKAAERLAMTQPPLTRLISRLEENLGATLLFRNTRRVELTPAGIAMLKEAREILQHMANTRKLIRNISKLKQGEIKLSFTPSAYYSPLPNLVLKFHENFPEIKLSLKAKSFEKVWEDLESGDADFIFCEGPLKKDTYPNQQLSSDELGIILPKTHPLAKRKKIQISELKKPRFIFHHRREAPHFHDSIRKFLNDNGADYTVRVRAEGESCRHLVAAGEGLLLATRASAHHDTPGVCFVPLVRPSPNFTLHALWQDSSTTELQSFQTFLSEIRHLNKASEHCFMGLGKI